MPVKRTRLTNLRGRKRTGVVDKAIKPLLGEGATPEGIARVLCAVDKIRRAEIRQWIRGVLAKLPKQD